MATLIWKELPESGGAGSGVTDINGQSGPSITIVGGTGISVGSAANTITITNTVTDTGITQLTGDVTAGPGSGSQVATLATVNGNVGSFGSSTSIPSFTVNAKGLITAASGNVVIAPAGTLTGTTLAANVVSSSLTSVGTITSGTWNGTTIAIANGGTGSTTQNFIDLTTNQTVAGNKTFTGTTTLQDSPLIGSQAASSVTIGGSSSTGTLIINGAIRYTTITITANRTVDTTTTDYIIFCDTSGGAFNLTLPAPTNGRILIIKDSTGSFGTNNLTLVRNAAEKIEGIAASKILQTNWGSTTLTSNGTDWFMI